MIDIYVKAPNEAALIDAVILAGVAEQIGGRLRAAPGLTIDVIGVVARVTGQGTYGHPIIETLDGWHANLRGEFSSEQLEALSAVTIAPPSRPHRVWA